MSAFDQQRIDRVRLFNRILSVFENDSGSPETDYKSIYLYNDGNNKRKQLTLSKGFTSDGGSLQKVMQRYIDKGGAQSAFFQSRVNASTPALVADKAFLKMLGDVSTEPAMREAQDEVFDEEYMSPALRWAEKNEFRLTLSVGVIVDSYLHSGSMPGWLMKTFPEKKPAAGGDERAWITAYLQARLAWFKRATGALGTTTYRPLFFLREIERGNWNLNPPLKPKGVLV